MKRRNLLKGIAAAGAVPMTNIALGYSENEPRAAHEPVVVDGLVAGTLRESYFEGMKKGGVHCAVAGAPHDIGSFGSLLDFIDARHGELVLARTVADIRRARGEDKYANVLCWHYTAGAGTDFTQAAGRQNSSLRGFREVGLRIIGLCYDMSHAFGGGNLGAHIPLTRAGRRLVEEIHRLGMVLDVGGHTGEQAALDAIAMAPGVPVICTGTTLAAGADGTRRISDRLIDAVAATGGVIGLAAVNDTPNPGNSRKTSRMGLGDYADQYDYIRRRVGVEHVGMGTASAEGLPANRGRIGNGSAAAASGDVTPQPVEGFERIEQFPSLVDVLRQRGWRQREIDLAMGENWLRIYERVWGA